MSKQRDLLDGTMRCGTTARYGAEMRALKVRWARDGAHRQCNNAVRRDASTNTTHGHVMVLIDRTMLCGMRDVLSTTRCGVTMRRVMRDSCVNQQLI